MNVFLIYILEVNLVLAVMYVGYWLICSRTTFFKLRRLMLLFIWMAAFIIPLIEVELPFEANRIQRETRVESHIAQTQLPALPVEVAKQALQEIEKKESHLTDYIGVIYATIVLLLIARQLLQVLSVMRIHKKSCRMDYKEQTPIYLLSGSDASFSFFKWIFIYADAFKKGMADEIIRHEKVHAMQWHSLDVCVAQVVVAVNWFNPFAYLLMIETRRNLEYLADRGTLDTGSEKKEYQMNLLRLTCRVYPAQIYNSFNYSHLKDRIVMMNKKPSSAGLRWTYFLLLLPAVAFPLLGVFAKDKTDFPIECVPIKERLVSTEEEPLVFKKESKAVVQDEELRLEPLDEEILVTTPNEEHMKTKTESLRAPEEPLISTSATITKAENSRSDVLHNKGIEGTWAIYSPDSSVINYKILTADRRYINLRSRDGGKTYRITRRGIYQTQGDDVYVEDLKQEFNYRVTDTRIGFKYKIVDEKLFLTFNLRGDVLNEVWERVDIE